MPKSNFVTKRCLEVLKAMIDAARREEWDEAEIVCEGGTCWLGVERVSRATVQRLLRCLAVSSASEPGSLERYVVSETGRAIAADPALAEKVWRAVVAGVPVDAKGDPLDTP
jgi:hypothetical protein